MTTLEWQGPLIMSGATPSPALEELSDTPGVYIYYKQYAERTVVYVGQSKNLWSRIFEHVGNFAGAGYALRDERGNKAYDSSAGMTDGKSRPYADLPAIAQDNVKRLVFIWAGGFKDAEDKAVRLDIEAILIKAVQAMGDGTPNIETDNSPCSKETIHSLKHNFLKLKGPIAPEIALLLTP